MSDNLVISQWNCASLRNITTIPTTSFDIACLQETMGTPTPHATHSSSSRCTSQTQSSLLGPDSPFIYFHLRNPAHEHLNLTTFVRQSLNPTLIFQHSSDHTSIQIIKTIYNGQPWTIANIYITPSQKTGNGLWPKDRRRALKSTLEWLYQTNVDIIIGDLNDRGARNLNSISCPHFSVHVPQAHTFHTISLNQHSTIDLILTRSDKNLSSQVIGHDSPTNLARFHDQITHKISRQRKEPRTIFSPTLLKTLEFNHDIHNLLTSSPPPTIGDISLRILSSSRKLLYKPLKHHKPYTSLGTIRKQALTAALNSDHQAASSLYSHYWSCKLAHLQRKQRSIISQSKRFSRNWYRVIAPKPKTHWTSKAKTWTATQPIELITQCIAAHMTRNSTPITADTKRHTMDVLLELQLNLTNQRDINKHDIITAWPANNKNSSNDLSAPPSVLKLLDSTNRLLIANALVTSPLQDFLSISCSKQIWTSKRHARVIKSPSDIRPITISNPLLNIVEKALASRIHLYYEHNNLLPSFFHGFRKHHNTHTAIRPIQDAIQSSTRFKILASLDISSAFDNVDLEWAWSTMTQDNVPSSLITRAKALATARHFFINDLGPNLRFVSCKGVPQGSPLSPLLFMLAVKNAFRDIPQKNTLITVYADDTTILFTCNGNIKTMIARIDTTLQHISSNLSRIGLTLNAAKSKFMSLGGGGRRSHTVKRFKQLAPHIPLCRNLQILGSTFTAELSQRFDLAKFRQHLKVAKQTSSRSKSFGIDRNTCSIVYRTWALSSFHFFATGRPPEQRESFYDAIIKHAEKTKHNDTRTLLAIHNLFIIKIASAP